MICDRMITCETWLWGKWLRGSGLLDCLGCGAAGERRRHWGMKSRGNGGLGRETGGLEAKSFHGRMIACAAWLWGSGCRVLD